MTIKHRKLSNLIPVICNVTLVMKFKKSKRRQKCISESRKKADTSTVPKGKKIVFKYYSVVIGSEKLNTRSRSSLIVSRRLLCQGFKESLKSCSIQCLMENTRASYENILFINKVYITSQFCPLKHLMYWTVTA